ncbi:TPA: type II CAAX endopeptidase family protein [Staphylococcus aureus]|uniref:CPBP family intramembrane glutamic endopeptidase n=1 Tax=Staphylococcus aureus TaxID=1280 RepID=UPI00085C04AE|nr:type II CAAX endopeptidase family protein [Staphylococcus aureus]SCT33286.1 CAAX amino terminal protease [Staphylococcus aureus]
MKKINEIFVEDYKVNKDKYLIAVIKVLVLGYFLMKGLFISDDVTIHMKYAFYSLALVGLVLYTTHLFGIRLWTFKKFNKFDILIVLGVLMLSQGFDYLFQLIHPEPSLNDTNLINQFSGTPVWLLVISISIVPAIVEEVVTRGFIMRVIFRGHLLIGLIVSSAVFALLHDGNNIVEYIPHFVFGIFMGLAYLKTRRIEVPIMIHFLNNLLVVLF